MAGIPRIPFDALPEDLRRELDSKVRRLGYLGEFFQVSAHQPEALGHFIRFTEALKEALPMNLVELVALTISTLTKNEYERVQHERLALKSGLTEAWVREVERLSPGETTLLSADEKAAQRLAISMATASGSRAHDEADAFLALSNPQTLMGVMLTVARYVAHSTICNTLQLRAPVPSPIDELS